MDTNFSQDEIVSLGKWYNISNTSFIVLDRDFRIRYANAYAKKLLDWSRDDVWLDKFFTEMWVSLNLPVLIDQGKLINLEPVKIKNHFKCWELAQVTLENKRCYYLLDKDVTQQEEASRILKTTLSEVTGQTFSHKLSIQQYVNELRNCWESIISQMPYYVYWKDKNFRYLFCNKTASSEMLGFNSPKEIIGKTDYDFGWDPKLVDEYRKVDEEILRTGKPKLAFEETVTTREGRVFNLLVSKKPLFNTNGETIGIIGITVDIAAQKEAERLRVERERNRIIEEEQEKFRKIIGHLVNDVHSPLTNLSFNRDGSMSVERTNILNLAAKTILNISSYLNSKMDIHSLIESLPGYVYLKNLDSVYIGGNENVAQVFGVESVKDIYGRTDYDSPWGKADSKIAEKFIADDKYVIETGKTLVAEDRLGIKNSSGFEIIVRTEKAPLLDKNGNNIGIFGIAVDITAQKEAERLKSENERHEIAKEEQAKFKKLVGQMIHDIQSPLSSLSSMLNETTSKLPEGNRNLLRAALTSITDITHHMLNRYRNNSNVEDEQRQPVFVYAMLLQILSEKRYEYKDQPIEFIKKFEKDTEFSFIKIEPSAFKRMLSNLVNNAVDALEGKPNGKIELQLSITPTQVIISIEDNGKGMSDKQIEKIKEGIEFSEGKKDGHGLGLTQVQDTIKRNEAALKIISSTNSGTSMILKFPKIPMPTWIADKIKIIKGDTIIVLDDDESIHHAWDGRFKPIIAEIPEIQIKHFTDGIEAVNFINSLSDEEKANIYLLTDYELLRQKVNGIDVIKQTGIKRSLLVTSHYADNKIRDLAINTQVKLLPKNLAFAVRIKIDKKLEPGSRKVDLVWVDDEKGMVDDLVEWRYSHLKVDTYVDPISFLEDVHQYPLDTRIILDQFYYSFDVDCELDGIKIAEILYDRGYTNLILLTGTAPSAVPDYLQVVLKKDKSKLFTLDRLQV